MTWEEVRRAFKEAQPVRVAVGGKWIECARIGEIGYKRSGEVVRRFVGALDRNGNSIYYVGPDDCELIDPV